MRVNAVSIGNYPVQQNFKGLSRTVESVKDETYYEGAYEADLGTFTRRKTIYYYPFADESQKSIDEVVSSNTYRHEERPCNPNSCDQTIRIDEGIVEVQKPLSVTKKEWDEYKNNIEIAKRIYEEKQEIARMAAIRALAPESVIRVENELNNLGLDEFIVK